MKIYKFLDGVIPVLDEKREQNFVELQRVTVVRQQRLVLPALNRACPLPNAGIHFVTAVLVCSGWQRLWIKRRRHHSVTLGWNLLSLQPTQQTYQLTPLPVLLILGPNAHKIMRMGFWQSMTKWNGVNGGEVLNTKRVLYWNCVLENNSNKEASSGVLKMGAQVEQYTVGWRQQYTCFRGGQPRYKESDGTKKTRNAPGSRLSGCTVTLNARLLKLEREELLHISFPLPSAHTGHSIKSLADIHSYKPLPEVTGRVESLVSNSYFSQVSLKLSLKEWVNKELIPQHIKQGILENKSSEYDRHYYPTTQDLRNITKSAVNRIRNNMLD